MHLPRYLFSYYKFRRHLLLQGDREAVVYSAIPVIPVLRMNKDEN